MADKPVKNEKQTNYDNWYLYRVTVTFVTPYLAPSLSPNKYLKKLQIQDVMKCYDKEAYEVVEHLDRAFHRDAECNILIPGHIFTASLREVLETNNIVVRGSLTVPKDLVRVGTAKAGASLLVYEYIPAGTVVNAIFKVNMPVSEKTVTVFVGARKFKGFGKVQLKFEEAKIEQSKIKLPDVRK